MAEINYRFKFGDRIIFINDDGRKEIGIIVGRNRDLFTYYKIYGQDANWHFLRNEDEIDLDHDFYKKHKLKTNLKDWLN